MPHRNLLEAKADFSVTDSEIVSEYLADWQAADNKYLSDDGNSKIISVNGTVNSISEDYNKQKVVLLKEENEKAGVSATFTAETNEKITNLKMGEKVTIKGVIRSGAGYDEDLGFYENLILEKCKLLTEY